MPYSIYAGIGSRSTPLSVQSTFTRLAKQLARRHFVLRSGNAKGADKAFEIGCKEAKGLSEIFKPKDKRGVCDRALSIAAKIHPAWHMCTDYAKRCHGRNVYQILGRYLDNCVDRVICWTPGGQQVGGTRTALVVASYFNVPIFNFGVREYTLEEILSG